MRRELTYLSDIQRNESIFSILLKHNIIIYKVYTYKYQLQKNRKYLNKLLGIRLTYSTDYFDKISQYRKLEVQIDI